MGLFSKKPSFCTICDKELTHKHKPKKNGISKGPYAGIVILINQKNTMKEKLDSHVFCVE